MNHEIDDIIEVDLDALDAVELRQMLRDEISEGLQQARIVARLANANERLRAELDRLRRQIETEGAADA